MTLQRDGYHHGDLRNALVASAVRLIETIGTSSFSVREAARGVGVSANAACRHFDDKSALMTAVAAFGFRERATYVVHGGLIEPNRHRSLQSLRGRILHARSEIEVCFHQRLELFEDGPGLLEVNRMPPHVGGGRGRTPLDLEAQAANVRIPYIPSRSRRARSGSENMSLRRRRTGPQRRGGRTTCGIVCSASSLTFSAIGGKPTPAQRASSPAMSSTGFGQHGRQPCRVRTVLHDKPRGVLCAVTGARTRRPPGSSHTRAQPPSAGTIGTQRDEQRRCVLRCGALGERLPSNLILATEPQERVHTRGVPLHRRDRIHSAGGSELLVVQALIRSSTLVYSGRPTWEVVMRDGEGPMVLPLV